MKTPKQLWAYLRPLSKILLIWAIIFAMVALGIYFGVDKKVIGVSVTVFGVLTNAFAGLMTLIAFVPFIGPLIIKVVALPIFWVFNGIGYFLSVFAIKRGYAKEVMNYRVLTMVFLFGIIVGFVLGSIF
ncbi:hypothetical protein CEE37_12545 [candidate division LCP-89 bacterium B3_LCP]|uniref:Uncharacterized protein n=1 Tax=candidate division LCP-89 bacterium B3_LCP TaxID=2012998 RepID=A0A532UUF9_UNCL8|nr:MAG: hypothetical protein CEE37_12545 [candidate division LCP-89 bacterium B3_LCP]